jgi:signal transduction histidine kinase
LTVSGELGVSARPVRIWAFVFLAFVSILAATLVLTSARPHDTGIALLYRVYAVVAPAVVGVLWMRRRPESQIGTLLVVLGALAAITSWQSSDLSLPFTIGVVAEAPYIVLLFLLCLTFPTGRLTRRIDWALVGLLVAILVTTFLPWLISGVDIRGGNPAFDCRPDCPPNRLQLITLPADIRMLLVAAANGLVALVGLAIMSVFVSRIRRRPKPRQRAMTAVAVTSVLLFPAITLFVFGTLLLGPSGASRNGLALVLNLIVFLFPIGFAVPLIQSELAAGTELQVLLAELAKRPSRAHWRDEIARAVDDPSLELGYWDDGRGRYIQADGRDLKRSDLPDDKVWLQIDRQSEPIAAIVTDAAIATEPELSRTIALATVAAVVNGQLEGTKVDLAARAADAAGLERMRLARDVHAGPQQRLAALRVQVTLVGQQLGSRSDERAVFDDVGRGLDKTIRELRDTIRTKTPVLVTRQGLGAALRAARRDSPINVRIIDRGLRRHPPRSELAVYYCCLEGIQNTTKHGGSGTAVTIRLTEEHGGIGFSIEDDGVGFDPSTIAPGSGLQNIAERITALGGRVEIRSEPGKGTVISGLAPDTNPLAHATGAAQP